MFTAGTSKTNLYEFNLDYLDGENYTRHVVWPGSTVWTESITPDEIFKVMLSK